MLYSADLPGILPVGDADVADNSVLDAFFPDQSDVTHSIDGAGENSSEIVFIDTRIAGYQTLLQDIERMPRVNSVHLISADEDGLSVVTGVLSGYRDLSAVHILSHGTDASLALGTAVLDTESVSQRQQDLAVWGGAMAESGDLLFYGCQLAASDNGRSLISEISRSTDADVAASTDATGHRLYSADWDLEHHAGDVQTQSLISRATANDWQVLLSVINVTTTDDIVDAAAVDLLSVATLISNPGPDGFISLREAIIATEADAGADEIRLAAETYILSIAGNGVDGDLDITGDLTIRGQGALGTTIDGNRIDRVFDVSTGVVEIDALTITGGKSDNGEEAGGIRLDGGTLTLNDITFDSNTSTNKHGGALHVENGTLFVYDSLFVNNIADPDTAPSYRDGGAIYNEGVATLERVTFDSNMGDKGGAIHNHGTLTLTDVAFYNNSASFAGGAIDNHRGGTVILDRVTFEANTSSGQGGAMRTDGPTSFDAVTLSGNIAAGDGGALKVMSGGTVDISHSTFVANISSATGGAISSDSNNVTLASSLFADNIAAVASDAIDGTITSTGFNIVDDAGYAAGIATDLIGIDPLPGPLQNNGGYVKTHAVSTGSAAVNAGGGLVGVDATGLTQDDLPDIGAHESRSGYLLPKLYWTDLTEKIIYRANEDGSAVQAIVNTTETPFDIEVDLGGGRIYWVEADGDYSANGRLGSLMTAGLDGSNATALATSLLYPTGLALDVAGGYVYVTLDSTTVNDFPGPYINSIVRYNLDGSNKTIIASGAFTDPVSDRIVAPTDIEYDAGSQRLYWTDRGRYIFPSMVGEEIKLIDLSAGSTQVQVIGKPAVTAHAPYGITLLPGGEELYWANSQGISYLDYRSGSAVESHSAVVSGSSVYGVQYHQENNTLYLTDHSGTIRSISADLSTNTILLSGLVDPTAIAVATPRVVGLAPVLETNTGVTVLEGGSTQISSAVLNTTDADTAASDLLYTVVTAPVNGRLLDSGGVPVSMFTQLNIDAGTISYQHFGDENTGDTFTFTVGDDATTLSAATLTIVVTPQNDAPVAVPDSYVLNEGESQILDLSDNDSDVDDGLDPASIAVSGGPLNGAVVVHSNGTVTYQHSGTETVNDSFTYTIDDLGGLSSSPVIVSLTITPVNDAPVAVADSYTINEGGFSTLNVSLNDSDDDDGLDPASIDVTVAPVHGAVNPNLDGTVTYTHDGSESVTDSFTYTIADLSGQLSDPVTVSLTITPQNDAPLAIADSFSVDEGAADTVNLITNDVDADDGLDPVSLAITVNPLYGTVTVNGDGTVTYTHNGSETLTDSFRYTLRDNTGAISNQATVSLTINAVNDAPTAVPENYTVNEGASATLAILSNDSDADDGIDVSTLAITRNPVNGTLVVNAAGTVSYLHDGSETLADNFSYSVDDFSGATSNTVTVLLTISPRNDAPVALTDVATVNEGAAAAIDVAANDTDSDDGLDPGSLIITSAPSHGTAVPASDGAVMYTHDGSETHTDSFTYTIDDNSATTSNPALVSVVITPQNDPPVAVADRFVVNEGEVSRLELLSNDSDADDGLDSSSVLIVQAPANGAVVVYPDGSVDYTHDGSETLADTFSYTIADLSAAVSGAVEVALDITAQNDAPIAVNDNYSVAEGGSAVFDVAGNDTDADDGLDLSSIAVTTPPANGVINVTSDGSLVYIHDGGETTADSFAYTIDDLSGVTAAPAAVAITVSPQNDPPQARSDSFTVSEHSNTVLDLAANDTDPDDGLDFGSIEITLAPDYGTLITGTDGTVEYRHDGAEQPADQFAYSIRDRAGVVSSPVTVGLTITPVNDPPVAMAESYTVNEGSTLMADLAANDSDAENGLKLDSISIVSPPVNGDLILNTDGTVDYRHDGSETLTDSFSYTIGDYDGAESNLVTVSLTITPVNDVPLAVPEQFSVDEGSTTTLNLAINDRDDDDGLDFSSIRFLQSPANGEVIANGDGTVNYLHDSSETLEDRFSYTIDDVTGASSAEVTVLLSVVPVNDAPVAQVDQYRIDEGAAARLNILHNDSDADDGLDTATVVIGQFPDNGTTVINPDGSVDYRHDGSETLRDSFSYSVDDNNGEPSNVVIVDLTINPKNDSPVLAVPPQSGLTLASPFLTLPADTFTDAEADDLVYTATLVSGEALPDWISFNAETLTFSVQSVLASDLAINVLLVATDPAGASVSTELSFRTQPVFASALATEPFSVLYPTAQQRTENTMSLSREALQQSRSGPDAHTFTEENSVVSRAIDPSSLSLSLGEVTITPSAADYSAGAATSVKQHKRPVNVIPLDNVVEFNPGIFVSLARSMEGIQQQLTEDSRQPVLNLVTTSAAAVSGLSVGYVIWLLRGGVLLASSIASLPAWRLIDPLPVLDSLNKNESDRDAESLQSMVEDQQSHHPAKDSITTDADSGNRRRAGGFAG